METRSPYSLDADTASGIIFTESLRLFDYNRINPDRIFSRCFGDARQTRQRQCWTSFSSLYLIRRRKLDIELTSNLISGRSPISSRKGNSRCRPILWPAGICGRLDCSFLNLKNSGINIFITIQYCRHFYLIPLIFLFLVMLKHIILVVRHI